MNDRREFLTVGGAGLAAALLAAQEAQAAPSARTIAQRDAPKVSLRTRPSSSLSFLQDPLNLLLACVEAPSVGPW